MQVIVVMIEYPGATKVITFEVGDGATDAEIEVRAEELFRGFCSYTWRKGNGA